MARSTFLACLDRPADFARVLSTRPCASGAHFAWHHHGASPLRGRPATQASAAESPGLTTGLSPELSTGASGGVTQSVDDLPASPRGADAGPRLYLGLVVPKRHAKRSVTRQLIRRQAREALRAWAGQLPAGAWVLRLRSPWDRQAFPSAASDALRRAVRLELHALLAQCAQRAQRRGQAAGGPVAKAPS